MAVDLTRATIDVNSDTERSSDGYDSAQGESWSDTSSDMTELHPDEFPDFFAERGGRLFHSHGRSPYPLPVDADEQHVSIATSIFFSCQFIDNMCLELNYLFRDLTGNINSSRSFLEGILLVQCQRSWKTCLENKGV